MKTRHSVLGIAKNMKISRQAMYKQSARTRKMYNKPMDESVCKLVKEITEKRPTYGYKRVTALVNKYNDLKFNKKRIYRIMKKYGLLLPKAKVERKHEGTGKVMVLHSNTRWCSDGFEIKCFNGEKVYVAFSLDCKDREAMSYVASKEPLTAKDIQKLMIKTVEYRFNKTRTPRTIQWLTDRGSIYRAQNVQELGRWLGLKCCYTAAYSPSSNGMAEAFVGTIKRDYVYVSDCYSADSTIKQLKNWFDDYNNVAPHSALDMQAPREYLSTINN